MRVGADLGFMDMIKLINYIRAKVAEGHGLPDLTNKVAFQDDHFLQPVLEDDPLLYSLHDMIGEDFEKDGNGSSGAENAMSQPSGQETDRVTSLEEKLTYAQQEIEARKQELQALKLQYGLLGTSDASLDGSQNGILDAGNETIENAATCGNTDSSYFASYSGHGRCGKNYETSQI